MLTNSAITAPSSSNGRINSTAVNGLNPRLALTGALSSAIVIDSLLPHLETPGPAQLGELCHVGVKHECAREFKTELKDASLRLALNDRVRELTWRQIGSGSTSKDIFPPSAAPIAQI